jgi:hypothetical protein
MMALAGIIGPGLLVGAGGALASATVTESSDEEPADPLLEDVDVAEPRAQWLVEEALDAGDIVFA